MNTLFPDSPDHSGRIRKPPGIKGFLSPQIPLPGLPVQNNSIQREAAVPELLYRLIDLFGRLI